MISGHNRDGGSCHDGISLDGSRYRAHDTFLPLGFSLFSRRYAHLLAILRAAAVIIAAARSLMRFYEKRNDMRGGRGRRGREAKPRASNLIFNERRKKVPRILFPRWWDKRLKRMKRLRLNEWNRKVDSIVKFNGRYIYPPNHWKLLECITAHIRVP